PPARTVFADERSSPPLSFLGSSPWQARHFALRTGSTAPANSRSPSVVGSAARADPTTRIAARTATVRITSPLRCRGATGGSPPRHLQPAQLAQRRVQVERLPRPRHHLAVALRPGRHDDQRDAGADLEQRPVLGPLPLLPQMIPVVAPEQNHRAVAQPQLIQF